jgi:hypothetical protein
MRVKNAKGQDQGISAGGRTSLGESKQLLVGEIIRE